MSNTHTPPAPLGGLRHVALTIEHFDACLHFYHAVLGMAIEWQPDADNIYLSSGVDNLALHRAPEGFAADRSQRLDHIGFILNQPDDVDVWYDYFCAQQVPIKAKPKTHRDGARSFYAADPDGNVVQMIYHPPIANI